MSLSKICVAGAALAALMGAAPPSPQRAAAIARAQVWAPTNIPSINFKAGPENKRAFAFRQTVECDYTKRKLAGKTPKFACVIPPDDELKVKYGGTNGEVYAEVAATRLLWGLGFGADHMYSVRVVCRGCPPSLNGISVSPRTYAFEPASVERKMPGLPFQPDEGWVWPELDKVDEASGGAPRAQRDALKLLAVFMQHSDTKAEQQRLLCLEETKAEKKAEKAENGSFECKQPFMMINDLGVTFGRANKTNNGDTGSMNLVEWSRTPVWRNGSGCVGNLPKSFTGTLDNPVISEEGRQFLADLLTQLSDQQLHDLFETARVTLRLRAPNDVFSGYPTIDEWVDAFKQKRDQIVSRRCSTT